MAVDVWTMEILVGLLTSLNWAQEDDPALGTQTQAKAAIQHVERILREKNEVFWKVIYINLFLTFSAPSRFSANFFFFFFL